MQSIKSSTQLAGVADLALMAPVKSGFIPGAEGFSYAKRLELLFRTVNAIRSASREATLTTTPFPDSVGRWGLLHSFRYALVPPDIDRPGEGRLQTAPYRLFLSVTFDGGWEPYLRIIYRDLGPLLDTIFCSCDGYLTSAGHSFDDYIRWVRRQEVGAGIFYAESAMTVPDQRYLAEVEQLQRAIADPAEARRRVAGHALKPPRSAAEALAALGSMTPAQQTEIVANNLRALKGLYDLRACFPANEDGDDRILLRFAQDAMPEFRELLRSGRPVPPDNQASADWLRQDKAGTAPQVLRTPPLAWPRSEIQAGVLTRYNDTTHGALYLLAVTDAARARAWLAALALTTEAQQPLPAGQCYLGVAFSRQGLQALGVGHDDDALAQFPQEFIDGMEARSGMLGDVRGNHPDQWQRPRHDGREVELRSVHIVLQARLADPANGQHGLHPRLAALRATLGAAQGVLLLATEAMRSWRTGDAANDVREHFGFRDGLSQPLPADGGAAPLPLPGAAAAGAPAAWDDRIQPGEVLLGHPCDRGGGVYPSRPNPLLDNGSFLVLRKMRQHVDTWHQVVQQAGRTLDPRFDHRSEQEQRTQLGGVAALLMGRTLDGEPTHRPGLGTGNDFDYAKDTEGRGCPFAAHSRRANPRTLDGQRRPGVPRLMRRGMSYGPQWREGQPPDAAGADRGLFFMAYCGSIAEQFEVVQRWITGGNSSGVLSGHDDPFLGVPVPGAPRRFQWLDGGGEVRRLELGEKPLTSLLWGLYLFVPSLSGLRALCAQPPAAPAVAPMKAPALDDFDAWRLLMQDAERREAAWQHVRAHAQAHGKPLKTAYGELIGDAKLALPVLQDGGRKYSVRGYGNRFTASVGSGYLGMDDTGPHKGHLRYAEDSGINAAIVGVTEAKAFAAACQRTRERLDQLVKQSPPQLPLVTIDVLDLGERVLGALCADWFGVPDGEHLHFGGAASEPDETEARAPRDLVDVARYIFGPHPGLLVRERGERRGRALRKAVLKMLRARRAELPQALPEPARTICAAMQPRGLKVVADILTGVMLGFTPSVFGNYSNLMRAWIERRSDETATLWDLQARLLPEPGTPWEAAQKQLRPALIAQMRKDPIPTFVWRERADSAPLGKLDPRQPDLGEPAKVVIGLVGVMQDPAAPEAMMFGGCWRGAFEKPPAPPPGCPAHAAMAPAAPPAPDPALATTHACPGHGMAIGVLLGIVSTLLRAGSLKTSPSPTIVYLVR